MLFTVANHESMVKSPLPRDFIDIGRVPYYGDSSRFRSELIPNLKYKIVYDGFSELFD